MNKKINIVNEISSLLLVLFFLGSASLIGVIFKFYNISETNIVIVYLLFVLLSARYTQGYRYGIFSSITSILAYNYFFTQPYFTFSVYDPGYIITFVIMMITAIVTSTLTSKIKQSAFEAEQKEHEMRILYQLTNNLTSATEIHDIAKIAVKMMSEQLSCQVGCLCFNEEGIPEHTFIQQVKDRQIYREVEEMIVLKQCVETIEDSYYEGGEFNDWPIYGQDAILGVIRIPNERATQLYDSQFTLTKTMIESIALAMDRLRQSQQRQRSKEEMIQERYRGNLLRSISHDLRTPLSAILGSSEMLMDMLSVQGQEYELVKDIHYDADWLRSMVENILNLTKIQEGKLIINKQYEALEEVIESALAHLSWRSNAYNITIGMPEQFLLIPMDATLIRQVLINLLDNAMKHTEEGNDIAIQVNVGDSLDEVEVRIMDSGEGISSADLPHLFQMFYTTNNKMTDVNRGIGLGLSICEAIVSAHGGKITAKNREDKDGAIFCFTLPLEEEVNE